MDLHRALELIDAAHHTVHETAFDPQETVTVALAQRDLILLSIALSLLTFSYPCLNDENTDLQKRIRELMRTQKPEWCTFNGEE